MVRYTLSTLGRAAGFDHPERVSASGLDVHHRSMPATGAFILRARQRT